MNYEHLMAMMEAAESENLVVSPTGPSRRVLGFMKDTNPMWVREHANKVYWIVWQVETSRLHVWETQEGIGESPCLGLGIYIGKRF